MPKIERPIDVLRERREKPNVCPRIEKGGDELSGKKRSGGRKRTGERTMNSVGRVRFPIPRSPS
jgi:hypothetical protein